MADRLSLTAGGLFAFFVAYQLQNGAAFAFHYVWVDRKTSPFWFWLAIAIAAGALASWLPVLLCFAGVVITGVATAGLALVLRRSTAATKAAHRLSASPRYHVTSATSR